MEARPGDEPFMCLSQFQLRTYLPHEISQLSVLAITQTKTFDEVPSLLLD
jgi:hypothetical protein